jgi:ATP-dependent DNA ligase
VLVPEFPRDVVTQPLERLRTPFDSPEWLYEIKYDGFRGLAYLKAGEGSLVSRNGNVMRRFRGLATELAQACSKHRAIVDGEITCLGPDGRPQFYDLMFRRGSPVFFDFDLLWLDGEDLRPQPVAVRKKRLRLLLGRRRGVLRYVDATVGNGCALFAEVCKHDLEGIVAKWAEAPYGLLDGRNQVIGFNLVAIGTLTSALVHPREVFKAAILANAAAIILVHNHPSPRIARSPHASRGPVRFSASASSTTS